MRTSRHTCRPGGRVAAPMTDQTNRKQVLAPRELGAHPTHPGPSISPRLLLAWLTTFDEDHHAESFEEPRDALPVAAATRDSAPVKTCLREWPTTAQALSDPSRRAILTAPGDGDHSEVDRPQA